MYGIVKQSGGNIWVYSEPARGTTFKIYLPLVETETEGQRQGEGLATKPVQGTETILVAEDETMVRTLARHVLEQNGYTVLEAPNGEEALTHCREHADPIHLLLTDVVMPGKGGREVAEEAAAIRPYLKVLYVSGYTDDAVVRHGVLDPGTAFLQKPFTPQRLAEKVREMLDA